MALQKNLPKVKKKRLFKQMHYYVLDVDIEIPWECPNINKVLNFLKSYVCYYKPVKTWQIFSAVLCVPVGPTVCLWCPSCMHRHHTCIHWCQKSAFSPSVFYMNGNFPDCIQSLTVENMITCIESFKKTFL